MDEKELNIIIELINREIQNYTTVKDRVNSFKTNWQKKIDVLVDIREKLKTKINYN